MAISRTNHEEGRLFESRLSQQLNPKDTLYRLATLIEWDSLEAELGAVFPAQTGRKAKPIRLMAGLCMLQSLTQLSDDELLAGWVQNPYWQFFCGFDYFQWEYPVHPSNLSRWRRRVGEEGMERLFKETIDLALRTRTVTERSLGDVIADTTVMLKNVAYPTDSGLLYRGIQLLGRAATRLGLRLRQSYAIVSKRAWHQAQRYFRARQFKRARREVRRLRTWLGRLLRDILRKVSDVTKIPASIQLLLKLIDRFLKQQREDKNKLYSFHEPDVVCIAKGKAHRPFEFGAKVSTVLTHREGLAVSIQSLMGAPYDGHTLEPALEHAQKMSGHRAKRVFVDRGYRGHGLSGISVYISGQRKGLTASLKKALKRRQAIEPHIGHMKSDGRLSRNFLHGKLGDVLNALLVGIGHNLRMISRCLCPT